MDINDLLAFEMFLGPSREVLSTIAGLCRIREYGKDDVIFYQDDPAKDFFGVLEGEVELNLVYREKVITNQIIDYEEAIVSQYEIQERSIVADLIGAGDVFGWSSFFDSGWTATAKCSRQSRIFSIPVAELKAIFEKHAECGYEFMTRLAGMISQRFHSRTDKLIDVWGESFERNRI